MTNITHQAAHPALVEMHERSLKSTEQYIIRQFNRQITQTKQSVVDALRELERPMR